jgi:hypothetical protein
MWDGSCWSEGGKQIGTPGGFGDGTGKQAVTQWG